MSFRTDEEILNDILQPEKSNIAFKELIQKYQVQLYYHIRKILIDHEDTDDALQNTFVKAWQNIHNFKKQSKLYTWLYKIATNEALYILKRKNRFTFFSKSEETADLIAKLESDPYFDGEAADLELQKAILNLPQKQRLVFNMRYFDEMSYEEIAEILGTSIGALKASYHHAVKKIENTLKQKLNIIDN
jgi:RNA polymerase sigma-70 factor (ECF subfamily)